MKTRLAFLALAALVLACCIWLNWKPELNAADREPLEKQTIIVASDLHYLSPALTDYGPYFQSLIENADGKVTAYGKELVEAFVAQVLEKSPDALILSGDLTFNGAEQSHIELAALLHPLKDAGIRVLVLPGNHDLENPMAASFQRNSYTLVSSVDAARFSNIYASYGYQDALLRDRASLSYVVELLPNLWVLLVDVNTAEAPGCLTEQTLSWVERQLKDAAQNGAWVLAVSHQNLLQHNGIFTAGYRMENADCLLALYESYGVICNLSGHLHIQHIAQSGTGLPDIATSSLAVSPNQYGVFELGERSASYGAVPVDVSAWAASTGQTSLDLLDFTRYSYDVFWNTSYCQGLAELQTVKNAEAMASYFADVNAAYFAGDMTKCECKDDLLLQWKQQPSFLSVYLQSIVPDIGNDYTQFLFDYQEAP